MPPVLAVKSGNRGGTVPPLRALHRHTYRYGFAVALGTVLNFMLRLVNKLVRQMHTIPLQLMPHPGSHQGKNHYRRTTRYGFLI